MNNNDTATMTLSDARRIADSLRDTRIYRAEETIIAAFDTLDRAYGTAAFTREDMVRMDRLRRIGSAI